MANRVYLLNLPAPFLLDDCNNLPLGLLYLLSYLKSKGRDISIVNLAGLSQDSWQIPMDGDVYGISATTPQYMDACRISDKIKQRKGDSAIVVLGGAHASALPLEILTSSSFDVVVTGEGEVTFDEIVRGEPLLFIKGIAFKNKGNVIITPPRPLIKNLDDLPMPDPLCLDLSKYHCEIFTAKSGRKIKGIDLITSRGCSYRCSFCASALTWQYRIRFHSDSYVNQQLKYLRQLGYNNFYFVDDCFTLRKNTLAPILADLKENKSLFRCIARSDSITPELVSQLYQAGCRQIDLGVESGSQRILDAACKKITVTQHLNAIQTIQNNNISCKIFILIGLPYEDEHSINETIEFINTANPDLVSLNLFVPYPGTPIWNEPQKYNFKVDHSVSFDKYIMGSKERIIEPVHSNKEMLIKFQAKIVEVLGEKDINIEVKNRLIERKKQ